MILPLHHVHNRCFSCGGARLRTLEAGLDNQSHGNSKRLARFSSLAELKPPAVKNRRALALGPAISLLTADSQGPESVFQLDCVL